MQQKSEPRTPGHSKHTDLFEDELEDTKDTDTLPRKEAPSDASKFGWIQGVLVCRLHAVLWDYKKINVQITIFNANCKIVELKKKPTELFM